MNTYLSKPADGPESENDTVPFCPRSGSEADTVTKECPLAVFSSTDAKYRLSVNDGGTSLTSSTVNITVAVAVRAGLPEDMENK